MKRNATVFLLGFGVIVAHLLLAKMLWGFPWGGVVVGSSLVAVVASAIGYFCIWRRRRRHPMRDLEIIASFREPIDQSLVPRLQRARPHPQERGNFPPSGDGGGCLTCGERRLFHRPQSVIHIPFRMAQNRCKKTQNNPRPQLPNLRF